jgi:outer membrane protein OmpA-like peptidoglycan-associated protein
MMADENVFFFSSDRPGGYGGTDIYLCRRQTDNSWGPAKNLGPAINTAYDEDAPFIHPDSKTLYFSSNGNKSMGGFDIFTCTYNRKNDSISSPLNIGYPVNTADDELFFVWSADGKRGYFSATKEEGFGEEDIYLVHRPNIKVDLVLLNGSVRAMNKLINAKIRVIDNATNEEIAVYDSTKFKGNYTILLDPGKNYTIAIEAEHYLSTSENINAPLNGFFKVEKNIELTPLDKGGMTVLNNVFFGKRGFVPKKESFWELDRYYGQLKDKPDLVLEIAGHANDFGDDHQSNLLLSKRRARAVADYMIQKGIDSTRIKTIGYGDQFKSLSTDTTMDKNPDNRTELIISHNLKRGPLPNPYEGYYFELQRKKRAGTVPYAVLQKAEIEKQREIEEAEAHLSEEEKYRLAFERVKKEVESGKLQPVILKGKITDAATLKPLQATVELKGSDGKIISEIHTGADGKYLIRCYRETEAACTLSVSKTGYNFYVKSLFVPANGHEKVEISNDMFVKTLNVGTKFTLRNIYYDFDRTSLRPESYNELNHLEEMLRENPKLRIEIAGHTDSHGPDYYNKVLSQRRSEAVVNYLVKKGIPSARVLPKGYGEEKPFASNDDELEGRELNRRTEILILKNE